MFVLSVAGRTSYQVGRKNVVWLSGGFPIYFGFGDSDGSARVQSYSVATASPNQNRGQFNDAIAAASEAMNTANIAVYSVDARGLNYSIVS